MNVIRLFPMKSDKLSQDLLLLSGDKIQNEDTIRSAQFLRFRHG